jgi:O-antigen ligase
MLGIVFYVIFAGLAFLTVALSLRKPIFVLYPLLVSSHFNVTSFFKLGITVSFFEVNLFICFAILLYKKLTHSAQYRFVLTPTDKVFLLFLCCALFSIGIAILRVGMGDLMPDVKIETNFIARSLMSLNKLLVFIPILIFIRTFLVERYLPSQIQDVFIKALVYSGVLPMLATLIQFSGIGFYLIHNNPSFAEVFHIENYVGQRIVGLTNEASFYVYQLFFSTLGIYYAYRANLMKRWKLILLAFLFIVTVIISISRTGLLLYILFAGLIAFREFKKNLLRFFLKFSILGPVFLVLIVVISTLNIGGFNLTERLLSTFQVDSDASTLERYGSMEALLNLIYDKCLLLGTGIYNYQYYIKFYLPYYMDLSSYGAGDSPPSFNFIFQLFAEFGVPLALLFFYGTMFILKKTVHETLIKDWFLFLFLFSLSFQTLNFAIPFLIILYPLKSKNEDSVRFR